VTALLVTAVIIGGAVSWFASTHPDGLEWSIAKVTGKEEVAGASDAVHHRLASIQEKTAFLPDYGFKTTSENSSPEAGWPAVSTGTSVSGIAGGLITLAAACLAGFALRTWQRKK